MSFISRRRTLQYFLPCTSTLFMLVTIERNVETGGAYDQLYGLPFGFISNGYAFTHHFDVYLLRMLLDLFCYFVATVLFFKIISQVGLPLKTHWTFIAVGIMITLCWIFIFYLTTFESSFKLIKDLDVNTISRKLHFGTSPW